MQPHLALHVDVHIRIEADDSPEDIERKVAEACEPLQRALIDAGLFRPRGVH